MDATDDPSRPKEAPSENRDEPESASPPEQEQQVQRAWMEPMDIHRLDGRRWVVRDSSGTGHVVTLDPSECTCPDDGRLQSPCRHLRRIAIEINTGRQLPPERYVTCPACDQEMILDPDDEMPPLCRECHLEPGMVVFDRERSNGSPMLVIRVTRDRADEVTIPDEDVLLSDYGANQQYSPSDPVVETVYPGSVSADRSPTKYLFPISRLTARDQKTTTQLKLPGHDARQ